MNAYEKLLAEAIPTGTFGRARPAQPRRGEAPRPAWTREEQAAHLAALEAALAATETRGRRRRPRLRVIDGKAA